MIYRDPKCVFVASDGASANLMAGLLEGAGFPSQVMNEATAGGFEGVTGIVPGFSHKGMEVWVVNPDHAAPAKEFLAEEEKRIEAEKQRRAARTGTVAAVCEECGKSSDWPASAMGTTENCPSCSAYMDIPDPEDDWGDLDVGAEDGENG